MHHSGVLPTLYDYYVLYAAYNSAVFRIRKLLTLTPLNRLTDQRTPELGPCIIKYGRVPREI